MTTKNVMEPLPKPGCGDHMTMEKFIQMAEAGGCGFIDYDGFAHYATKTEMLASPYIDVTPSMVLNGKIDKRWTHVVWFNR